MEQQKQMELRLQQQNQQMLQMQQQMMTSQQNPVPAPAPVANHKYTTVNMERPSNMSDEALIELHYSESINNISRLLRGEISKAAFSDLSNRSPFKLAPSRVGVSTNARYQPYPSSQRVSFQS